MDGHYRPTGQCFHCKKWDHKARDCTFRRKQINFVENSSYRARPSMKEIVCWRCNKKGHFKRDCKERLQNKPLQNKNLGSKNDLFTKKQIKGAELKKYLLTKLI